MVLSLNLMDENTEMDELADKLDKLIKVMKRGYSSKIDLNRYPSMTSSMERLESSVEAMKKVVNRLAHIINGWLSSFDGSHGNVESTLTTNAQLTVVAVDMEGYVDLDKYPSDDYVFIGEDLSKSKLAATIMEAPIQNVAVPYEIEPLQEDALTDSVDSLHSSFIEMEFGDDEQDDVVCDSHSSPTQPLMDEGAYKVFDERDDRGVQQLGELILLVRGIKKHKTSQN
ncbi:uncharacterized protein G2W53_018694 [Senna tora]|uniref:Uncharacterized protein n=1 Tax=Senna tora TaxID=362788 RepID=A0A834TWA0_9FABA|nr:uncharacterized protein G2W53_018694 [Senna tora]